MIKLKYEKLYRCGGGGYKTTVDGKKVLIERQYCSKTWVAQSDDGSIDIEWQYLADIKYILSHWDEREL
jgi:hypothetical protein